MIKNFYALIFIVTMVSCASKPKYKIIGTWRQLGSNDNMYFQFTEEFNNGFLEKRWQTYDNDKKPLGGGTYRIVKDTIWQIYEFPEFSGNKDSSMMIIRKYEANEFLADHYNHSWDDLPNSTRSHRYSETFKLQRVGNRITINGVKPEMENTVLKDTSSVVKIPVNKIQDVEYENNKYYTLGSTEQEVLNIQGEPNSIGDYSSFKVYTYGASRITFENGVVKSYENNGNLKLRVVNTSSKALIKENQIKYIYFTAKDYKVILNEIKNDLAKSPDALTEIFTIEDYTRQKQAKLWLCVDNVYKEFYNGGAEITLRLEEHLYDTKEAALNEWYREKGKLLNFSACNSSF